ncbi:hypothetical protein COLO4_07988 [Corchorus olitorius]|uniref:Uncharacterized protein n=1 Tax=Corchorus olitorius TaxID=93759 RepID=A0A1R3KHU8_9ROSI|nr:hypothetical protein COLO4_07988 [Corchorus olitorius]
MGVRVYSAQNQDKEEGSPVTDLQIISSFATELASWQLAHLSYCDYRLF